MKRLLLSVMFIILLCSNVYAWNFFTLGDAGDVGDTDSRADGEVLEWDTTTETYQHVAQTAASGGGTGAFADRGAYVDLSTSGANEQIRLYAGSDLSVNDNITVAGFYYGDGSKLTGISGSADTDWTESGTTVTTDDNVQINGSLTATGNIEAATYGSDNSVSNAELLYINTLSSNAQTQIGTKAPTANATFTGTTDVADLTASGNVEAATYGSDNSVSDAELLYIGTLSSNAQTQITNNAALVDTDDEIIAIINASPGTQIKHEAGGLEADVSAYNGFLTISGGSTAAVGLIDTGNLATDAVNATVLDVSDVSDDIAGDIAEGELANSIIVSADIKDGEVDFSDDTNATAGWGVVFTDDAISASTNLTSGVQMTSDLTTSIGVASDNLDDTDASIEWEDGTDLESDGAVTWGNIAAGELADNTVDSDDFVHEDWGEVTNASGTVVIDDSVAVSSWNLTTPTITTSLTTDSKTISEAEIGILDGGVEGTEVISTGEGGASKYLREDGDGTCSWQTPAAGSGDTSPFLTTSSVVYVDNVTHDFAIGGTDSTASFWFDEAIGGLDLDGALTTGGNNAVNFTTEDNAQWQINATLAADLTIDSSSTTLSTAAMRIGTDLTTDGTHIFWKGGQLSE